MPDQFKTALRNSIKQVRSKVTDSYRNTSSNQICERIRALSQFQDAQHIALYHPINGEIDLTPLWIESKLTNKTYYFPVLNDNSTLSFFPATPSTQFKKNKFGIPEPEINPELLKTANDLDLILMPLVAFDMRCSRLGMGAGYYDRTLENKNGCLLFGVGYQFQRVDFIAPDPWDVPLDAVVTQRAVYWREAL